MIETTGYGIESAGETSVRQLTFHRDEPKANQLLIEVLYCGLCHSDVEVLSDNWGVTKYPCVPGHEAVGRVIAAGPQVIKHKIGDIVGVGAMMDSCMACAACSEGWENHCEGPNGCTTTNTGFLSPTTEEGKALNTLGAWADNVLVSEEFAIRIPEGADPARTAPLMCAGTDIFGPLKRIGNLPEKSIGILGLGGPGHLAVQIAKAMGTRRITVFTTHPEKRKEALRLGADDVVVSTDKEAMSKLARSFDHILSTIPVSFDPSQYLALLRRRGSMTVMALLGPYGGHLNNFDLAVAGLSLTGSMMGSVAETQESVNFCAQHNISPLIELVEAKPESINNAIERLKVADVRFRFVIKMK